METSAESAIGPGSERATPEEVARLRANLEARIKLISELEKLNLQEHQLLDFIDHAQSEDFYLDSSISIKKRNQDFNKKLFWRILIWPASMGMFVAVGLSFANFEWSFLHHLDVWLSSATSILAAAAALLQTARMRQQNNFSARSIDES